MIKLFQDKQRKRAFIIIIAVVAISLCGAVGYTIAKYVKRVEVPDGQVVLPGFHFYAESEDADSDFTSPNVIDINYDGTIGVIYLTNYKDTANVSDYDITYKFNYVSGGTLMIGSTNVDTASTYTISKGGANRVAVIIKPTVLPGGGTSAVEFGISSTTPYVKSLDFKYIFTYNKTQPSAVLVADADSGTTTAYVNMNSFGGNVRFRWQKSLPYGPIIGLLNPAVVDTADANYLVSETSSLLHDTLYELVFVGAATPENPIVFQYYAGGAWVNA